VRIGATPLTVITPAKKTIDDHGGVAPRLVGGGGDLPKNTCIPRRQLRRERQALARGLPVDTENLKKIFSHMLRDVCKRQPKSEPSGHSFQSLEMLLAVFFARD
jgi:hypothetical protein